MADGGVRRARLAALGLLAVALAAPLAKEGFGGGEAKPLPALFASADGGVAWREGQAEGGTPSGWRGMLLGAPLDTSSAGWRDYDALPEVGGKLSHELAREAGARGGFTSPEALLEVRGIGPKKLETLRPWLKFTMPGAGGA